MLSYNKYRRHVIQTSLFLDVAKSTAPFVFVRVTYIQTFERTSNNIVYIGIDALLPSDTNGWKIHNSLHIREIILF